MDRRAFVERSAAWTTGAGLLGLQAAANAMPAPATVDKLPASERIQVGCIGVRGRAGALLRLFSSQPDVDVVALADVDSRLLPKAVEEVKQRSGRAPRTTGDFRHLIDDPRIDVVVVGTPDHWHAIPTILACQAGKDVYVEKPDGHNLLEGQRMVQAMRRHRRIVQLGTQARTSPHFHEAVDYIRSGRLGTVLVAKAWETSRQGSIGRPADSPAPAGVDYDMWLGPAPQRPFNPRRFHGNWRWFFDYGTGDLGNDGVHRLDYARWALSAAAEAQGDPPLGLPHKISALGGKWYFDDLQEWPDTLQVQFEFAPPRPGGPGRILTYEMRVWVPYNMEGEGEGAIIYGDRGYLILGNGRWRAYGPQHKLLAEGQGSNDGLLHVRNFLDCVKSRQRPNADLETVGHPSSVLCHAANVAWRVGRQLVLDPQTETFVGDAEANQLRTRPEYRKPWSLPEVG